MTMAWSNKSNGSCAPRQRLSQVTMRYQPEVRNSAARVEFASKMSYIYIQELKIMLPGVYHLMSLDPACESNILSRA